MVVGLVQSVAHRDSTVSEGKHTGVQLPAPLERSQVPWCFGYSSNVGCSVVLLCLVAGARSLDSSDGHRQTIIKIAEACCAFLWSTRGNERARQLGARRGWWWRVGTPSARCTHEKLLATLPLESKTFMHWTWPKKTCMSVRTPPKDERSFHRGGGTRMATTRALSGTLRAHFDKTKPTLPATIVKVRRYQRLLPMATTI